MHDPMLEIKRFNTDNLPGCEAPGAPHYSLFISNYAFSELKVDLQEEYFRRIIACADRGFLEMNSFNGWKMEDFINRLKRAGHSDATVLQTLPNHQCGVFETNTIVWGTAASVVDDLEKTILKGEGIKSFGDKQTAACKRISALKLEAEQRGEHVKGAHVNFETAAAWRARQAEDGSATVRLRGGQEEGQSN